MPLVLVVDDAQFMRVRLAKLLTSNGYEVVEAENGWRAVEVYEERRPDVVLMDITMPELDGIAALKEIKSRHKDARVIMCSALGQEKTVIEAVRSGAKDFIVKPFDPAKVLEAVRKQVG